MFAKRAAKPLAGQQELIFLWIQPKLQEGLETMTFPADAAKNIQWPMLH